MNDTDLADALEQIRAEVRRHGRAAVAAQAAAEQCLEALGEPVSDDRWLRTLLPVADGLDRTVQQAERADERARWPWQKGAEIRALAEGLRVLRAQLLSAFDELGVEVERPARGDRFDAERHRAVGTRRGAAETVVELVRPGYVLDGKRIREADVIVGDGR